ncbi:MAG TPA: helix-turn-helix domain-containing protein [Isosphaeraceae bacterium]|nr:helix-turn-helix domain-containing protein [Isosphaeraceae bacterium]
MTVAEATAYLKVGRTTLYRLMKDGVLPSFQIEGGHRRFRQEDLDRVLRRRRSGQGGTK